MSDDFMDDGGDDFWDGPDEYDWVFVGMAEDAAKERREQKRIEREMLEDDDEPDEGF